MGLRLPSLDGHLFTQEGRGTTVSYSCTRHEDRILENRCKTYTKVVISIDIDGSRSVAGAHHQLEAVQITRSKVAQVSAKPIGGEPGSRFRVVTQAAIGNKPMITNCNNLEHLTPCRVSCIVRQRVKSNRLRMWSIGDRLRCT